MSFNPLPLTLEELTEIRSTFEKAVQDPKAIAACFYARLFSLDPSLRALFHGDMRSQGEKLIGMLQLVVSNLQNLEQLLPTVRQLGLRHAVYGVKDAHYALVGTALIQALRNETGAVWNDKAEAAWVKAYELLAQNMKVGAAVRDPVTP